MVRKPVRRAECEDVSLWPILVPWLGLLSWSGSYGAVPWAQVRARRNYLWPPRTSLGRRRVIKRPLSRPAQTGRIAIGPCLLCSRRQERITINSRQVLQSHLVATG